MASGCPSPRARAPARCSPGCARSAGSPARRRAAPKAIAAPAPWSSPGPARSAGLQLHLSARRPRRQGAHHGGRAENHPRSARWSNATARNAASALRASSWRSTRITATRRRARRRARREPVPVHRLRADPGRGEEDVRVPAHHEDESHAPQRVPAEGVQARCFSAPRNLASSARVLQGGATLLGGGTDLGLVVTKQLRDWTVRLSGKRGRAQEHRDRGSFLEIGGAVTYAQAHGALAAIHPDIGELLRRLGGAQVRACGTIAGNIANGSPIGDSMPFCLRWAQRCCCKTARPSERWRLENFYTGYRKSVLQPGEFIRSVRVPKLARGARFAAYKVSKRFDQDISAVCAAFHVQAQASSNRRHGGDALARAAPKRFRARSRSRVRSPRISSRFPTIAARRGTA